MNPAIQRLRAFAIAAVILIHSTMHFTGLTRISAGLLGTLSLNVMAQFAVPCFFFISGFALMKSYKPDEEILSFYKKRFARVLPLYLLACLAYGLFFHAGTLSILSYIRSVVFGSAAYHLWFIPVLFQFYLLFPLFIILINKFENRLSLIKMTAYCFALQIISQIILKNLLADMPLIDLIGNRLFLYYIGYFALGVTLAHSTFSPFGFWLTSPRIYIQSALYFVLCVILRTMAQKMKIEHVDSPIWLEIAMTLSYTAFSTAISISLYQILRDYTLPQPIARIIDYMADKSYAIYLFHVLILEIALRLSMPLFSSHPFILAISIFITVTVTMLAFCSAVDISRQLLKKNA